MEYMCLYMFNKGSERISLGNGKGEQVGDG